MQMYFEVSDPSAVAKINEALKGQKVFYKKLDELEAKYGADTSLIFHTLQDGLRFSCLCYKSKEDIDTSLFRVSYSTRGPDGEYWNEARPRKSNKRFYAEFMDGIEDFKYLDLCKLLFDVDRIPYGISIEFKDRDDKYYFSVNRDIVLGYRELTATQYKDA